MELKLGRTYSVHLPVCPAAVLRLLVHSIHAGCARSLELGVTIVITYLEIVYSENGVGWNKGQGLSSSTLVQPQPVPVARVRDSEVQGCAEQLPVRSSSNNRIDLLVFGRPWFAPSGAFIMEK